MPTIPSILLTIQGIPILLFGATILYDADKAGFGDVPLSVSHVIGFSNLSLGAAYLLAVIQSRKTQHQFLLATMLVRVAAAWVFQGDGADARGAPAWDYGHAGLNFVVLGLGWLGYI